VILKENRCDRCREGRHFLCGRRRFGFPCECDTCLQITQDAEVDNVNEESEEENES